MGNRETALEVGLGLLAAGLITAAGILIFGRASGGAHRSGRRDEPAPEAGSISPERHQHIAGVSAR